MRRWRGITTAVALLALVAVVWSATQMQSVQVRKGVLRQTPTFLGKITARVAYGDRLEVLETKAGWTQVRNENGESGWIHTSALSTKIIVLKAGQSDLAAGASGDEIALAGKGFNEEVESTWRGSNPEVDYAWVDRMEEWVVTPEDATKFLSDGGVQ
jgi:hypothetical protein